MSDRDLSPREVAELLGVTVRTVQRWVASGELPASRVGGRVRVSRSSLAAVASTGAAAQDARPPARPIRTVLVANRGEIARRVARTARALGLRVIGVHEPDDVAPRGTDEVRRIGSYLDGDEIVRVARDAGADAVHPGYGFLAENASFASAALRAGLAWIGPPPAAITALGDKANARRSASDAGVPVLPGYDGDDQADATLAAQAERIGYPLLVKPTAGGGGKGMRVVRDADGLRDALTAARREALRAFGDERLILERYAGGARHVEVQVLFDAHGAGIHLGERDCSAQRRSQKVVEEAPGPAVDAALRARMGEAALRVAGSVGYVGAGTVEMLLTDEGEFFFLEMNARLQVEHPVTEAVTGRDIVADQLRIASGESLTALGLRSPPPLRGHAVEARLYAEDPESGFLPATGRVLRLEWPDGVRVDAGVERGDVVGDRYDPMLAKLIAHGPTRGAALDRLRAALDATTVLGVRTNLRFLRWLIDQPSMRDGEMRTDTIEGLSLPGRPSLAESHWQAAAHALRSPATRASDPWSGGWRLNAPAVLRLRHADGDRLVTLPESRSDRAEPADAERPAAAYDADARLAHVDVEGQSLEVAIAPAPTVEAAVRHATTEAGKGSATLTAPMPGRVIAVRVPAGASVQAHQAVVVIEAMKMEHAVVSPIDGTVVTLRVGEGQQVQRGDLLGEVARSEA